jgi:hypothetical protein
LLVKHRLASLTVAGETDYYSFIDFVGSSTEIVDIQKFNFWPTSKVESTATFREGRFHGKTNSNVRVFIDYFDESWFYAVDSDSGSVAILGAASGLPQFVASRIDFFIELYVRDDPALYAK